MRKLITYVVSALVFASLVQFLNGASDVYAKRHPITPPVTPTTTVKPTHTPRPVTPPGHIKNR